MKEKKVIRTLGKVSKKTKAGGSVIYWDRYIYSPDWH